MTKKEALKKQIEHLEDQLRPLQEKLREIYDKEAEQVEARIKLAEQGKGNFTLDELRFAAYARCECGAGLTYPTEIQAMGAWYCSDILLGRAPLPGESGYKLHTPPMPFAFYEVKSEDQPSANGLTTRPKE